VSLLGRLLGTLKASSTATSASGEEVWGADRSTDASWRQLGRDEGSFAEHLAPGDRLDIGPGLLGAIPTSINTDINSVYGSFGEGQHRASGGPVLPGRTYNIGEAGPETLVMGPSGGMVIPNSGAGGKGMTDDRIVEWLQHIHAAVSQRPPAQFNTTAYGRS
jgi:hypothetical protein